MEKVVKFCKNVENTDYEQERYKKDFQEYLKRKESYFGGSFFTPIHTPISTPKS